MSRFLPRLAAPVLVWLMLARMLGAATVLSPVVDEQSHISRGVSVLRTGDARLQIGHPIGLNLWQALPLALDPSIQLPLDHEAWLTAAWDRFGDQFLWHVNANPDGIVFRARVMVMLLTLVLGALVFRWARELHGPGAGLLALALYTLDPNVIAHGMLATTDLGVTLFVFAATYALWRATRSDERRWYVATGALAGLALVTKYSALFLIPVFAVLLAFQLRGRVSLRLILRRSAFIIVLAVLVVLAIYLLRIDLYLSELSFLMANMQTHPSFLLGERSIEGWWYYFLVTFVLKTPLPTLLFVLAGLGISLRQQPRVESQGGGAQTSSTSVSQAAFLIAPPALYLLFSVASGFNVGYRHLLPALPFLFVYVSQVARMRLSLPSSSPAIAAQRRGFSPQSLAVIVVLVAWLGLSSFGAHPDFIAYFNEAAPAPRYDVLIDSNLDWGQSLKQLRAYLEANSIERVKLSYFGTADPSAYGIAYDPLPRWPPPQTTDFVSANPAPGAYAISASNLQGVLLDDPSTFDWFRHRRPDAIVGQSILVYHVAADANPPQAVGLCREPWTPIDDERVGALLGRTGLRVVRFDCVQAWWWPDVPAWYIVPPYDGIYRDTGLTEYARRRPDDSLVYQIFRNDPPEQVARSPLETPARFDGGLTLLGFTWFGTWKPGEESEVESAWQVDAPVMPPVSIFAHLLDPAGGFVVAADGLGVPAELLRPGDRFVQQHRFLLPAQAVAGEYAVEFGFYRLDTLERYPVVTSSGSIDRRVLVKP